MSLPVDEALPALLAALAQGNVAVLQAPPGAGKTTRVPPALLDASWLNGKRILMLEPRRIATRAAARYMAQQRGEEAGATVGYRTRLDTKVSAATRIEVVTEGILTRLLQDDPSLGDYGIVIFDEFHERSLQADLGLALARESQLALREDLRLLVMSATLDTAPVAALLGNAPVIRSEGRAYPVATRYRAPGRASLVDHVADVVCEALARDDGSQLVFLPGVGEIRRVERLLAGRLPAGVRLAPLYGDLTPAAQDAAIAPARDGERKVVLATSIAETSVTIDGVRVVIDSGQARRAVFDPNSAMTRLETRRVSAAEAEQRRGRAGRTAPGMCIRLWGEEENTRLAPFAPPEILEADLAPLVLELAAWGERSADRLCWLDPPPAAAWQQGRELLQWLEALDRDGAITAHGRAMLREGVAPRLAHMLVHARRLGLGRLGAELAALLGERDLMGSRAGCDVQLRLDAVRGGGDARVDRNRLQAVREQARRLMPRRDGAGTAGSTADETPYSAGRLLALAYPDRVARRRPGKSPRFLLANGRGALLPEDDALAGAEWLVACDLDGVAREARIYQAGVIDREGIEELLAGDIVTQDVVGWDDKAGAVVARRERRLGAIVLEESRLPALAPEQVARAMLDVVRNKGVACLPWEEGARQLQARSEWLRRAGEADWPDLSDAALLASLDDWALPFMDGITRLAHLAGFPLAEALRFRLGHERLRRLDAALPVRLTVPSGSSIAIDYTPADAPVLAVKLQEMFGLAATPQLAGGRVPLRIHLLSPAQRPVAVTADLASFWKNGYPDVRKDLRGRYPKHPWPEDPLSAPPRRGAKRPGERE